MEGSDQNSDFIIKLLARKREIERENEINEENRHRIEQADKLRELKNLHEKQARIKENIKKNLKSLVGQKHGLQKVIQGSDYDVPKLPVTHKHQQDVINFVCGTINFVNDFPDIQQLVQPESDIDPVKLCHDIKTCGESVNQELNRSKTRIDQIESFRENTDIIKNHCFLSCDDQGLIG